jgi:hypothetical protein
LLAVLLLLLAGAAGIAYYRLQSGADARAGAPQSARVGEGPGSVAQESAGDTPGVASNAETTGGGDTAVVDAADAAGSSPGGVDSVEAVSSGPAVSAGESPAEPAREGDESPAGASGLTASTPPQEPALGAVVEPLLPSGAVRVRSETGASATVVRISAPWEFGEGAIRSFRLENPPRFVVQVRGADQAVPGSVSSPLVLRVRIGVHPATAETAGQPEIHFVFDLAAAAVRSRASVIGGAVVVTFSSE